MFQASERSCQQRRFLYLWEKFLSPSWDFLFDYICVFTLCLLGLISWWHGLSNHGREAEYQISTAGASLHSYCCNKTPSNQTLNSKGDCNIFCFKRKIPVAAILYWIEGIDSVQSGQKVSNSKVLVIKCLFFCLPPDFSFSLSVSQACYGILKVPQGNWLCRTCALGVQPKCLLCPKRGGALKPTRSGTKWVHVSCALWIPEVRPEETDRG